MPPLFDHRHRDHPRGCGENSHIGFWGMLGKGSPPRMRGKHTLSRVGRLLVRITPADAGKTFQCAALTRFNWDHPRGCGENLHALAPDVLHFGSPPRMRGKLRSQPRHRRERGITPADAGKTTSPAFFVLFTEDHPRGCGENTKKIL